VVPKSKPTIKRNFVDFGGGGGSLVGGGGGGGGGAACVYVAGDNGDFTDTCSAALPFSGGKVVYDGTRLKSKLSSEGTLLVERNNLDFFPKSFNGILPIVALDIPVLSF
jgi:hypothetical protein